MTGKRPTSSGVTDTRRSGRASDSRNEMLFAEWETKQAERARHREEDPEWAARIDALAAAFGGGENLSEEERQTRSLAGFAEEASLWCSRCHSQFNDGDVVYRRRRGQFESSSWTIASYCDGCVSEWHPSWRQNRHEPVPCAAGCGVLVSHWQWYSPILTCSRRCSHLAAAARKRVEHEPRLCEGPCGETFVPTRADARYCSSACRQDAYRQRKAGRL